eukprot:6210939-Pleurochrysis_carterae.AAC.2
MFDNKLRMSMPSYLPRVFFVKTALHTCHQRLSADLLVYALVIEHLLFSLHATYCCRCHPHGRQCSRLAPQLGADGDPAGRGKCMRAKMWSLLGLNVGAAMIIGHEHAGS